MVDTLDSAVILAELRSAFTGAEPPSDLLQDLGGWDAIRTIAPNLVDDPLLLPVAYLVAREVAAQAEDDLESPKSATTAVAVAVLDTSDPGIFASGVELFCGDALLSRVVGNVIAARCLALATPPAGEDEGLTEASVIRRAAALEGAARLAITGRASKNKLLGLLEDVQEPQPRRYAQAVTRTVEMAFDHWLPDDNVADVIDILTGVAAPNYGEVPRDEVVKRNEKYCKDAMPDAEWTLANIAVGKALRLTSATGIGLALDSALKHLTTVIALDDRDDAELLRAAVVLLRKLLLSLPTGEASFDAANWDIELADAQAVAARAGKLNLDRKGLNHWSGDRKIAVLQGWNRLAQDLAFLKDQLSRDSIYAASMVMDNIVAIYSASHAYDIKCGTHEAQRVVDVVRPAIAGGFGARAGLLRHLSDHTDFLRGRLVNSEDAEAADLRERLATAEQVLKAARESLVASQEPPGKQYEQVVDLPPLLADFFDATPAVAEALESVPQEELGRLVADIADLQAATELDPDLTVTKTRQRILTALASAEDFCGDVVPAVTAVLDQLIKFVRQRLNSQKSWKSYQFNPDANEHDLHVDLYEWLSQGQFGSSTNVEVQEVGAGRADIQIQFAGFHLYLELKVDRTSTAVVDKTAYIKQTASYQASDVRIGFLVVLRMAPLKSRSPSAHLTEYVSHASVPIKNGETERHVVMLEIPGNQTNPSRAR
ncbi:hypothetical protein [Brevibacterium aurantiacum]|uniref:hypothetical protein n=1 Tax=Brevibacterium aurantiacum TaxID=273384 RepID=UPI000F6330D5|nr:hypothetical protein [Brevibacterium aurantiacum]AZL04634.1 hypothetical protein CXR24_02715 [Brevibacterium aurantiacum]